MSFSGPPDAWIERNEADERPPMTHAEMCEEGMCDHAGHCDICEQPTDYPLEDGVCEVCGIEWISNRLLTWTPPEVSNLRCNLCGKTSDARTFDDAAKWIGRHECSTSGARYFGFGRRTVTRFPFSKYVHSSNSACSSGSSGGCGVSSIRFSSSVMWSPAEKCRNLQTRSVRRSAAIRRILNFCT